MKLLVHDGSLEKLGLDYLDLFLVHQPLGDYYGSWRAMEELYATVCVRAIGVCNLQPNRIAELDAGESLFAGHKSVESVRMRFGFKVH